MRWDTRANRRGFHNRRYVRESGVFWEWLMVVHHFFSACYVTNPTYNVSHPARDLRESTHLSPNLSPVHAYAILSRCRSKSKLSSQRRLNYKNNTLIEYGRLPVLVSRCVCILEPEYRTRALDKSYRIGKRVDMSGQVNSNTTHPDTLLSYVSGRRCSPYFLPSEKFGNAQASQVCASCSLAKTACA